MVAVMTAKGWFDEMLGDIKYSPDSAAGKLYPFFVRVGCVKRRPPRHAFFEMFREMGAVAIDAVFEHDPLGQSHLSFVFPERHMGVAEQQAFMHYLEKHPEAKDIKAVDIITSSPLIVGSFMRDHIRILTWEEDSGLYDCAGDPT